MQRAQAELQESSYGPIFVLTAIHALLANSCKYCNLGNTGLAGGCVSERTGFFTLVVGLVNRVNLLPCGLFLSDKFG